MRHESKPVSAIIRIFAPKLIYAITMKKLTNLLPVIQMLMLVAVMLLAGSTGAEAKKENMKGLYVAGAGEYEDSKAVGKVRYLNGNFEYYPVVGRPCCYYIPSLRAVYITSCTINGVLVETTKNYPIPKLQVIISGNVTVNTSGDKSCVRMYYKSLEITKSDDASTAKLVLKQTGDKKGMFTSNGGITVKDITLQVLTRSGNTAISQEGSGHITFNNCSVSTNGPIYAKGYVECKDCKFTTEDADINIKTHYLSDAYGKKIRNVQLVVAKGGNTNSSASSNNSSPAVQQSGSLTNTSHFRYHKSYDMSYSEVKKVSNKITRYKIETPSNRGTMYVFKDTGGGMVILLQNFNAAGYGFDFDFIGKDFKILVDGNCSIGYIRADRFQHTDHLFLGWGKLDDTSSTGYRTIQEFTVQNKRECASATLTLNGDMASPINLNANYMFNTGQLTVMGLNIIARHANGMKYQSVIRGCKEMHFGYCTLDGSYKTPFSMNDRVYLEMCGPKSPTSANLYYSRNDCQFMNADCLKIVRENNYYDFSTERSSNFISIR